MQRTHGITALAASVGTLTLAAAFGFAQPDGLEPPAGPVADTQPSLTEIRDLILASGDDVAVAEQRRVWQAPNFGGTITVPVDRIILERVTILFGAIQLTDGDGRNFSFQSGSENVSGAPPFRVEPFEHELGIILQGPLAITDTDGSTTAGISIVYRELP